LGRKVILLLVVVASLSCAFLYLFYQSYNRPENFPTDRSYIAGWMMADFSRCLNLNITNPTNCYYDLHLRVKEGNRTLEDNLDLSIEPGQSEMAQICVFSFAESHVLTVWLTEKQIGDIINGQTLNIPQYTYRLQIQDYTDYTSEVSFAEHYSNRSDIRAYFNVTVKNNSTVPICKLYCVSGTGWSLGTVKKLLPPTEICTVPIISLDEKYGKVNLKEVYGLVVNAPTLYPP